MRAVLSFTLPDDDHQFLAALRGDEALSVLWEIDQRCRSLLKHGEQSAELRELAEEIRDMIPAELLQD